MKTIVNTTDKCTYNNYMAKLFLVFRAANNNTITTSHQIACILTCIENRDKSQPEQNKTEQNKSENNICVVKLKKKKTNKQTATHKKNVGSKDSF